MDYSMKSFKQKKYEEKEFNRQGCIQFLLFFLIMIACIAIIALTQK